MSDSLPPNVNNPIGHAPDIGARLISIRNQFLSSWNAGTRPRIEDFLDGLTELDRILLLRELLHIEWQRRQLANENPTREEYRQRFPQYEAVIQQVASTVGTIIRAPIEHDSVSISQDNTGDYQRVSPPAATGYTQFPQQLGYQVLGILGQGGMGVVYEARDQQLNRLVALKMIRGKFIDDEILNRFRIEAEAVARLQHPNIVQIYAVGEHDHLPFVVLELVKGGSLKDHANGTPLLPREAARIVELLAQGVQAAHDAGIIHRDLKPANVLMTADGIPKISDFGLAKRLEDDSGQTQTGAILGTPSYMSPEQAAGRTSDIGPATDIYSLGAILYELLTGRPPFRAATSIETIRQVIEQEPAAPRQLNPTVDRDVETICLKCLSKIPARRYQSARDLSNDLQRWLRGEPITARPVSRSERLVRWCARNRIIASLILTAAILLIAVASISTIAAFQLKNLADRERNETVRANGETKRANQETAKAVTLSRANATLAMNEKEAREKSDKNANDAIRQTQLANRNLYAAHMNLVQSAWEEAKVGKCLKLLDLYRTPKHPGGPDDLRGFEWFYWDRMCHGDLLTLKGSATPIFSLAMSSNGRLFATGTSGPFGAGEASVQIWDSATGRELMTLNGHVDTVVSLAFSPNGERLAAASGDRYRTFNGQIKVWNLATGKVDLVLQGHMDGILSVAYSPDGQMLASAGKDKNVNLWNASDGHHLRTLTGHSSPVNSVAFSPNSRQVASSSDDKTLKVWDIDTGKETSTFQGHTSVVTQICFSPDGARIASASADKTVIVWNLATGKPLVTLTGHLSTVSSLAFGLDGHSLASTGYDQTVRLWDSRTGAEMRTLRGHTGEVMGVAFSSDRRRLFSASLDRTIKIWSLVAHNDPIDLQGHTRGTTQISFSPNGAQLASANHDKSIKIWDVANRAESFALQETSHAPQSIAFSPDGRHLAAACIGRTIKIWDLANRQEVRSLNGNDSHVEPSPWETNCIVFRPDGKRLASIDSAAVLVWEFPSGKRLNELTAKTTGRKSGIACIAYNPSGQHIVAGYHDGTCAVWNAETAELIRTWKDHEHKVESITYDSVGRWLVSASSDHTIKIWDAANGQALRTLIGHTGPVHSIAFNKDGTRLGSGSMDQTVKLWDPVTGQETLTLKGLSQRVSSVTFSPDGKQLAAANLMSVRLWDLNPQLGHQELKSEIIRRTFHRLNSNGYQQAVNNATQHGLRPAKLEMSIENGVVVYRGEFVPHDYLRQMWVARHKQSDVAFKRSSEEYAAQGYQLDCHAQVMVNGQTIHAGVWLKALIQESKITSPNQGTPPKLLVPFADAELPNGDSSSNLSYSWDFDWEDVSRAKRYHLIVQRKGSEKPVVDRNALSFSEWKHTSTAFIVPDQRTDWYWKVRSYVDDQWTPWSEERPFKVGRSPSDGQ